MRFFFLIYVIFWGVVGYGYFANIYYFARLDFEPKFKAEVIRGVGILIPPVGVVTGFMHISDSKPTPQDQ